MITSRFSRIVILSTYWALLDIKHRFIRYRLGSLWDSFAFVGIVAVLATFFGTVLKRDLPGYTAYTSHLACSMAAWMFLSTCINQACSVFSEQVLVLRYTALPFEALPLRITLRNALLFFQNIVVILLVQFAISDKPPLIGWLVVGIVLLVANAIWLCQLLALVCVRFRDLPQILSKLLHLIFLLSPILWMDHFLGRYIGLLQLHPVFHLLAIVREPLRGFPPGLTSLCAAFFLLVIGGLSTSLLYRKFSKRVPYWI